MPMFKPILLIAAAAAITTACSSVGPGPKAEYDAQTGRLRTLVVDSNRNGKDDTVSYMDGARIIRIELDLDENGKVERWDFYKPDRTLDRVGFARLNDGVMDAQAFYRADGSLERMEVSTRRDRHFDRVEFYEAGVLARTADDTNNDGRADKWDTYRAALTATPGEPAYTITATEFDDSGSGRPERRFTYGANGAIARVEVDPDGDGAFMPMPAPKTPVTTHARN